MNKRIMSSQALTVEYVNKSSWHLSVFELSADAIQATDEKFMKCGMDGYQNPFEAEHLYRVVSLFFKKIVFKHIIIRDGRRRVSLFSS